MLEAGGDDALHWETFLVQERGRRSDGSMSTSLNLQERRECALVGGGLALDRSWTVHSR